MLRRAEKSFENFVATEQNRVALSFCQQLAESSAEDIEPLFLYGASGLGKTHLLIAIEKAASESVLRVTGERYLMDFMQAVRSGKMIEFREKYRYGSDILLIDDLHLVGRLESLQIELMAHIDEARVFGQKVVLTSDRAPTELKGMDEHLQSRFEGGSVIEILAPQGEGRLEILMHKSLERGLRVSPHFLELLSRRPAQNVRQLEGWLNKLDMALSLRSDLSEVELLWILGLDDVRDFLTPEMVLAGVSYWSGVPLATMRSNTKKAKHVEARSFAMLYLWENLEMSFVDIAALFQLKHHASVSRAIHALRSRREQPLWAQAFKDELQNSTGSYLASKLHLESAPTGVQ